MRKIKKGDSVYIAKGRDRGRTGKVLSVFPKEAKVIVEGINIKKRHVRPRRAGEKGQIVQVPGRFPWANARVVCPHCKKSARLGFIIHDGQKFRICKKCKGEF